jgi:predicted GNAT family acetyltransferase
MVSMEIKHDEKEKKFYTEIDGKEAFAEYEINDGVIDFHHTFVPEEFRGKGVAKALYDFASKYIVEKNLKPEPSCSYAAEYFKKNYKKDNSEYMKNNQEYER